MGWGEGEREERRGEEGGGRGGDEKERGDGRKEREEVVAIEERGGSNGGRKKGRVMGGCNDLESFIPKLVSVPSLYSYHFISNFLIIQTQANG